MNTFAIGDIHGMYKQLKSVLQKSKFDYENDKLIILGDIVDKGTRTKECVDELLKVKHRVFVEGNHDTHFKRWIAGKHRRVAWRIIGGMATMRSYGKRAKVPIEHKEFFEKAQLYYVEEDLLFVHGGINPRKKLEEHEPNYFRNDRKLIKFAKKQQVPGYNHIFIGHTSTQIVKIGSRKPITYHNLTLLDTGASLPGGKITIMNVYSREYWQA